MRQALAHIIFVSDCTNARLSEPWHELCNNIEAHWHDWLWRYTIPPNPAAFCLTAIVALTLHGCSVVLSHLQAGAGPIQHTHISNTPSFGCAL